ncbi:hypothetical protein I7I53_10336 [Histoplasma capsulatum var. duboisii H88]|uniref:Uncharacterized protein n=1 Tax=Ajellomyces capsulatus (strain H88) TaxID=544711 RepID=A0A8A1L8G0_AJEC8|nr:hypothetical protein I7I53_10336 [Histoplasma capsulatum var. duboisii H88]
MGHPLVHSLPDGPVAVYPYPSASPGFFHTDPACAVFFSSAMNINGSVHSNPSASAASPPPPHSPPASFAAGSAATATASSDPAPTAITTASQKPAWKPASSSAPLAMNPSRKRSRDDYTASYSIEDDQRDSGFGSTATSSPSIEEVDPTCIDDMGLLSRDGIGNASPSSGLRRRKSQRLDASAAAAAAWDDNALATIQAKLQSSSATLSSSMQNNDNDYHKPKRQPSSSSFSSFHPLIPQEPQLDSLTLLLGISWQRVSRTDDADVAAALRGWERYIQNHYATYISQAEILLKHRGLGAFLVAAQVPAPASASSSSSSSPSSSSYPWMPNTDTDTKDADANGTATRFYLFSEDLAEARLVGNDWDSCLRNLREVPFRYEDGSLVLRASSALASAVPAAERVVGDKGVLVGCGDGAVDAIGMDVDMGMGMDIDW